MFDRPFGVNESESIEIGHPDRWMACGLPRLEFDPYPVGLRSVNPSNYR